MTPRERVTMALHHQEPDRVPIDFNQTAATGITIPAYTNLVKHLGFPNRPIREASKIGHTAVVDDDVLQRFHVDTRAVGLGGPDNWHDEPVGERGIRDEWGVIRSRPKDSYYYDLAESPMAEMDTKTAIEQYNWPDPDDPGRYRGLGERARDLYENTDYAIVLDVNCTFFLRCGELRGWENFYMDLAGEPEFAVALMERFVDYRLKVAERALAEVGEHVDVVMSLTDDLGMADRTLVSPQMYRELVKPLQKRVFDFLRSRTNAPRFYHCDGAVYPIIEDFIEVGTDILNPVQISAAGMGDTKRLKREFGDRLSFWGGVDTSKVLPFGTPEDVRNEVQLRMRDLGPGGGYVVCAVHNIQPEVPPENIVAMYDAAYELGSYPLA